MSLTRLFLPLLVAAAALLSGCASVAPSFAEAAFAVERGRAELVRKQVDLPGGLQMAYLEGGQGEPLVLVHGFGGNKDNFTRVARWLTPHYRVVVPDLVGFGESSHAADVPYDYATQARRLQAFLQALGLDAAGSVHLGGNSMGGAVALSYAAQFPARVGSLWLLAPAGMPEAPASELRTLIETTGRNPLLIGNEDDFAAMLAFIMSEPPWIPRWAADVMARERIANQALEKRVFEQIALDSVTEQVRGLRTPALIVWGQQDRLLHVGTAPLLHGLLPRSKVRVMPGIGHVPMVERPQQTAEDYLAFRASLR